MSIKRERKFRHLIQKDRDKIDILIREGYTLQKIAKEIGFNESAISRELQRNICKEHKKYVSSVAQVKSINRKSCCVKKSKFDNPAVVSYVKSKLKESWSPEQISGTLKKNHPEIYVSHEAIYKYIYSLDDIERKEFVTLLLH